MLIHPRMAAYCAPLPHLPLPSALMLLRRTHTHHRIVHRDLQVDLGSFPPVPSSRAHGSAHASTLLLIRVQLSLSRLHAQGRLPAPVAQRCIAFTAPAALALRRGPSADFVRRDTFIRKKAAFARSIVLVPRNLQTSTSTSLDPPC
jgi:hypothetical protein